MGARFSRQARSCETLGDLVPVTVPLNDSMSALMDAIAAAMAAARLEQAQALSAQSFLRGCVSRKGRDETRGDVQAVAERINAPPTPPVKIPRRGTPQTEAEKNKEIY